MQAQKEVAKGQADGMIILLAGLLLCGACIVHVGVAGTDCPVIARDEVVSLMGETFTEGDNPTVPTVNLESFHIVCLASGTTRGEYRFVSLVANYTCEGNFNCPTGPAVSQFDFSCNNGDWGNTIFFSSDHIRSDDPQSDFSTAAQEECSYCATQAALEAAGLGNLTADNATHCVACSSDCNEGLMRCYGHTDTHCCNYYNHTTNSCITECPSEDGHYTVDSENVCRCQLGYTGALCDENIDECSQQDTSPCQNGGTCVDTDGSFNCTCPVGFHGNRCEEEESACASNPCLNGGTCVDGDDTYTCECAHGYMGANCSETDVDECLSSPCKNNATCCHMRDGFTCECGDGWEGDTCEECTRENCKTCRGSPSYCAECTEGYELSDKGSCDKCSSGYEDSEKGKCVKRSAGERDKDDDNGLRSDVVAGIVIGCILILAAIVVAAVAAYFVIKRLRSY